MESTSLAQSPFAALTFIAAPALLTNASSVLALSTINRMLRTRDRMQELFAKSEGGGQSQPEAARLIEQVNRVERQATLLLRALHSIYVALAAFACSTLVTLLGAGLGPLSRSVLVPIAGGDRYRAGICRRRWSRVGLWKSLPCHATLIDEHSRGSRAYSGASGLNQNELTPIINPTRRRPSSQIGRIPVLPRPTARERESEGAGY